MIMLLCLAFVCFYFILFFSGGGGGGGGSFDLFCFKQICVFIFVLWYISTWFFLLLLFFACLYMIFVCIFYLAG